MTQKEMWQSRILMMVIAAAIAISMVYCYKAGIFQSLELLTLDGRSLFNSSAPRHSISYNLTVKNEDIERLTKDGEQSRLPAFDIIFIDMPAKGADAGMSLDHGDCDIAVKILTLWGAKAIGLSGFLSEGESAGADKELAETIANSRGVCLSAWYDISRYRLEDLYSGEGVRGGREPAAFFTASGVGHINAFPDSDGRLRRVPAVIRYKGRTIYQLGLKLAFDALGVSEKDIQFDPDKHLIRIKVPVRQEEDLPLRQERWGGIALQQQDDDWSAIDIPLQQDNQVIINWGCAENELAHVTFRDLVESYRLLKYKLNPIVDPEAFKDKICILGTEKSNAVTVRPPVLKEDYASTAASGLIAKSVMLKTFVRQSPRGVDVILIVLVALVFGASLTSPPVLRVMMMAVVFTALIGVLSIYGMSRIAAVLIAAVLSVPLGIFFARLHLFSVLLFTIFSVLCYLIVSTGLFKLFDLAIVTFYPVLAIVLIFISYYAYIRLREYLSTVQLFNLATKDGLTGLYNRRHINMLLDAELKSATLHKVRKLSVVMCDIDNFKKLNDTYGHQAGDSILKEFAKIMKLKCRQSDVVARYGGEEFIIMLSGAGAKDAMGVAENIRAAIADKKFTFYGQLYSTGMSMGLVEFTNEQTKEELIKKADQALYRAKEEGKNRVCVYYGVG